MQKQTKKQKIKTPANWKIKATALQKTSSVGMQSLNWVNPQTTTQKGVCVHNWLAINQVCFMHLNHTCWANHLPQKMKGEKGNQQGCSGISVLKVCMAHVHVTARIYHKTNYQRLPWVEAFPSHYIDHSTHQAQP